MYKKTIIEFGFCYIRNNQGIGKCNQLRPCLFWISQKPHPTVVLFINKNVTSLMDERRVQTAAG